MPHRRHVAVSTLALLFGATVLAGCQPQNASPPQASGVATAEAQQAPAKRPVDAVLVLRDRLLARDGLGFARLAVPPALFTRLEQGWASGDTRWPLDELPLDARIPGMLAALQKPGAEKTLMATFNRQFAGADRDIDQAIRTLAVFGGEFVQTDAAYTEAERQHIAQAIAAMSGWGLQAPLSDAARAKPFFAALAAAAQDTGIDAESGEEAYAGLGMARTLERVSPFIGTLVDQLDAQYGLDLDAALHSLQASLMQQTGDEASLRLRYTLAGRDIDAVVPVVRIDRHWYLANYLARAEASLADAGAQTVGTGGKQAAPP